MDKETYHRELKWEQNPFIKSTGFQLPIIKRQEPYNKICAHIGGGDRLILLTAPIGSGKTTFMNQLIKHRPRNIDYVVHFDTYEPVEQVMYEINKALPLWKRLFSRTTRAGFGEHLHNKLGSKKMLLVFDEAQDYNEDLFKWLRIINDRAPNAYMLFLGIGRLEDKITAETSFRDRKSKTITLPPFTQKELREIIRKRIKWAGGGGIQPFTEDGMDYLCSYRGNYVPRQLLEDADKIIEVSAKKEVFEIDAYHIENALGAVSPVVKTEEATKTEIKTKTKEEKITPFPYSTEDFPRAQQDIINLLSVHTQLTIAQIAEELISSPQTIRKLILRLRGLDKEECARRPQVTYPVVVELRGGEGRARHSYALSEQARRVLAKK